MQQNSKCKLYGDKNETINHIISESIKLAQTEYKTRHDWVDKTIHRQLCKKLRFDNPTIWYMYKLEPILKNKTHNIFWDFDIQTDQLIPARRSDFVIVTKKRTRWIVDFDVRKTTVKIKENETKKST